MIAFVTVDVLTVVVVAANVLGGAMALPQAAKLVQSRRIEGISSSWAGISVAVNAWWAAYGIGVGDHGIVPVSVVSVMAYLAIAVALVRFGGGAPLRTVGPMVRTSALVAVVPVAALLLGGWTAAGVALGLLYGVQLSPAVVVVYRSIDVSGVSIATWTIALAEAVLWGLYGLARLDVGLISLATTGVAMSALVLVRLFLRRPRHDRHDAYAGLGFAPA